MSEVNNHDALIKQIDELMEYATEVSGTLASIMKDCRAAMSQSEPVRYVPMTQDELAMAADPQQHMQRYMSRFPHLSISAARYVEKAVILRAIAQGAKLEVQE